MVTGDLLELETPGPGSWFRDTGHFPDPVTRLYGDLFAAAFPRGTAVSSLRYGSLSAGSRAGFPQGFAYFQNVPAPPAELPERRIAAEHAFAERIWREDLERWDTVVKPASIQAHRRLQRATEDLDAVEDEVLSEHISTCIDHFAAMAEQHHHFNGASTLPLLDFVVHANQWTGREASEVLSLMEGASAVSRGDGPELNAAVAAVRADAKARRVLEESDDLDAVVALGGEAGGAVGSYRDDIGARLATGFDFVNPTVAEVPGLLARTLRTAVTNPRPTPRVAERAAELRAAVPAGDRPFFDELLSEARLLWRLRDERGVYSDAWAAGILRLSALSAGRRLAARGLLEEPEHILEADPTELRELVRPSAGVDGAGLARRASERAAVRGRKVPDTLGPPAPPPEVPEGWPARAAALMGSQRLFTFPPPSDPPPDAPVSGTPANPGTCEGRARLVVDGADLANVQEGDILVMSSTSEAVCVVVPLLAGVVTDHGGLISHAAIVAREAGIPAVVGCGNATTRINDGDRVRVDGTTGEVVVLEKQ